MAADATEQATPPVVATPATPISAPTPDNTVKAPKITKVFVSDKVDNEGYASESNFTIPTKAQHIYVTIEVDNVVPNTTTLGVDLTGPDIKTGGASDLKKSGLVLKSFDFVRTKPWNAGEYQVDVALPNGDKRTVKFSVKD